ncbi:MAG: nicotinate (nicotinamide) nucleotide adenylyltransferase [Pseudomonadales bacterium]
MICLFGGTFDPVHVGHVHAARTVCDALALDEIRLLLSARPGHRGSPGASVQQRWDMLRLACAEDVRLIADDIEVRRARRVGRPSFTVETLEEVRNGDRGLVLAWVVGSDAYREITSWHRWREVFELSNLVVLQRPGAPLDLDPELRTRTEERQIYSHFSHPAGSVRLLDLPMRDVSATAVRRSLAASSGRSPGTTDPVADLLPPAVYTYIKKYHLYGVVSDA